MTSRLSPITIEIHVTADFSVGRSAASTVHHRVITGRPPSACTTFYDR